MRNIAIWSCGLVFVFGCGKGKESKPASDPPAGSGSAAVVVDAAAATPPPPAGNYDSHMKAGEALEDKRKWSEALVEFEAAVAAKPDDARALAEVGFTAYKDGKLDRAKQASIAAALATKDDKLRGAALFNIGLTVEATLPNAAASLYATSLALRPNPAVRARLAKVQKAGAAKATPEGDALLVEVNVKPGAAAPPPAKPSGKQPTKPVDLALMDALEAAGVEWDSGAGKSALHVEDLVCKQSNQTKPATYECTNPAVKGKPAQAIVENLIARKVEPVKEHGDVVTYKLKAVLCKTYNMGEITDPDFCELEP